MKKNKILKYLGKFTFIISAILCGILLGNFINDNFFDNKYINLYKEEDLIDNTEAIINEYNTGKITFNNINENNANKALAIAVYKCNQLDYFKVESSGVIKNSITNQTLTGNYEKNKKTRTSIQLSNGVLQVANKVEYVEGSNEIKFWKGEISKDGKTGNFKENDFKIYNLQSYKEYAGVDIIDFFSHIVSEKTILSATMKKQNSTIIFNVSLDAEKSTIKYKKQMAVNSGIKPPTFKKVQFNFEIDSNFKLLNYEVIEEYVVSYGVSVSCTSTIKSTFKYK